VRVLVTGGSGFIGTNLVEHYLSREIEVANVDIAPPRNSDHKANWVECDILDREELAKAFTAFKPSHVLHLAARTDLVQSPDLSLYAPNTTGVRNVLAAIRESGGVHRAVFASTKLVCRNGHTPTHDEEYCPDTAYGRSKVEGEKLVRDCDFGETEWAIVRPTSIWGPWFAEPYLPFFRRVIRGAYAHPRGCDHRKSYGYVGNAVCQVQAILEADGERFHGSTYYLSDYEDISLLEWANEIRAAVGGGPVREVPLWCFQVAAKIGDVLQKAGVPSVPITSFRLRNMETDTGGVNLCALRALTGPLPFSIPDGVKETVAWMKACRLGEGTKKD
jgi:nucleoside-diphosphate-sugar epimerase